MGSGTYVDILKLAALKNAKRMKPMILPARSAASTAAAQKLNTTKSANVYLVLCRLVFGGALRVDETSTGCFGGIAILKNA